MPISRIITIGLTALLVNTAGEPAAAVNCAGAARQVVSDTGGELLSALPASDGSNTCVVTVIIPASNGQPPRKVTRQVAVN